MTTLVSKQADVDRLRQCLEPIVRQEYGEKSRIEGIRGSRSSYSSFYSSDIIDVSLYSGREFKIFLKDFGSYKNPKDSMALRRERELRVYRDLLAEADLGTAKYYGSAWDESEGRFWLLLECVNGSPVRYCPFEDWVRAAAWLGRLQGYFSRQSRRFSGWDFLVRHNADYFWSKAELAFHAVSQISVPLAARLEKILSRYGDVVRVMASQPTTFIHGSYTPTQILFDSECLRICPIDWELAGLGSPLYDLAIFSDGFEPQRLHQLWDAYRDEAARHDISVPGREEMQRIADCFRLHRIMNWLSKSVEKQYPERKVKTLLDRGEKLGAPLG